MLQGIMLFLLGFPFWRKNLWLLLNFASYFFHSFFDTNIYVFHFISLIKDFSSTFFSGFFIWNQWWKGWFNLGNRWWGAVGMFMMNLLRKVGVWAFWFGIFLSSGELFVLILSNKFSIFFSIFASNFY